MDHYEKINSTHIHFPFHWLLSLPFLVIFVLYLIAATKNKPWPIKRTIFFSLGIGSVLITFIGPLAEKAHLDFTLHMVSHLLLGMLAPLLIVLGTPITLLLRSLSTVMARRLTRLLQSYPVRIWTHPILALFLNIGGLWILYTTTLYSQMHDSIPLFIFVHLHLFLAGYFLTVSVIYIDPIPHRYPFLYRAIIFFIYISLHGILAKFIYTHPPTGVPLEQAKQGAIWMYYGGDFVDVVIILILCFHWYKATRREKSIISSDKSL